MLFLICFYYLLISPIVLIFSLIGLILSKYGGDEKDIKFFAWVSICTPIVALICASILWFYPFV